MTSDTRTTSLFRRLWLVGGCGSLLLSALTVWGLGFVFEQMAKADFDRRLATELLAVLAIAEQTPDGRLRSKRPLDDVRFSRIFSGSYWQMGEGDAALRSRSLGDRQLRPLSAAETGGITPSTVPGPMSQTLRQLERRVLLPGATQRVPIMVAGDLEPLRMQVRNFRWITASAIIGMAALLLTIVGYQIRYGLRPLSGLHETLERIQRGDEVRLGERSLPSEIAPLVRTINSLLAEHEESVARARHAAQDLAHALKSPLAVLQAEARRKAPTQETVLAQIQRMYTAVDWHLATATPAALRAQVPVGKVLQDIVSYVRSIATSREIRFEIIEPVPVLFQGSREDLEEMLGNLLDNAGKWCRTHVQVRIGLEGSRLKIVIDDDGPGMAQEQYALVLKRGVRLDEKMPGSGLGLSIVDRLAAAYGGQLLLSSSAMGGLRAELDLPGRAVPKVPEHHPTRPA